MKVLSGCRSANLLQVIVISVACIAISGFKQARAEEKEEKREYRLEEVIVTATKTEKEVKDVPASVSVITSEEIGQKAATNLGDILRDEVGIEISGGPRALQAENPNIRGLDDERILLKIDETRYNFISGHKGRLFIDVDDIERVEVIRGPASALYGSDAIGGVIQVFTKEPKDKLEPDEKYGLDLKGQYDSVNTQYRESLQVFARPLDWVEYMAGFTRWDSKSFKTPTGGSVRNSSSFGNNATGKLIFHPTENSDLKFNTQFFKDNAKVPANAETTDSRANRLVARDTERQLFNTVYDYTSDGGIMPSLHTNIYWHLTEIFENALTGSLREDTRNFDTFGFEIRANNKFGIKGIVNSLIYGFEFYRDKIRSRRKTTTGISNISGVPDSRFQGIGTFLQNEIELSERWTLIPGLRFDLFKSTTTGQADKEDERVSPKIGATYKLTEAINLFGNIAWGFRAPRPGELFASGTHFPGNTFVPNPGLRPEKSINYEVGLKSNFGRLKFDSSVFLLEADDFIETTVTATTTRANNIGEARIYGLENSLEFDIGKGLSTFATYDFLKGDNLTDDTPLASIPPDTLVLGLRYVDPEDRFWAVFSGRIVDKQARVPSGTSDTAGYALWDIKTGLPIPGIKGAKLTFGIENIFDKAYREHLSSLSAPGRNIVVGLSETIKW
jgi:hemoglobin/transferrin/lactoferrin receptor protein